MNKKFINKKPIELTEEETYELVKQIAEIEYNRNSTAKMYQDLDDCVVEFFTYMLEKDFRGKKGLNNHYRQLSMKHFENLVHLEIRNQLNYQFRKKSTQKLILESDSLDKQVYYNNDSLSLGDTIEDLKSIREIENNLEIDYILNKIKDNNSNRLYIKMDENNVQPFNYRNLTKLYYNLSSNKRVNNKELKDLLFNKFTHKPLEDNEIKNIINNYKSYLNKNNILGGALA